ncbi:MAG TPA: hypothetical protein PKC67_01890 [Kiritimatiellia bacterium]|nr:hypothetical protein [Kiritimatiellia bacterium]HMP33075.1 hypothetical protein [Kiritimatiellia bacterium]
MKPFNDKYRISLWLVPDDEVTTTCGRITFSAWCQKECERLSRRGDQVQVHRNKEGRIALFRSEAGSRQRG